MIHYYVWNFVLEVSSVALAVIVIYAIICGTAVVCRSIARLLDRVYDVTENTNRS